jgi:hypothetical protein
MSTPESIQVVEEMQKIMKEDKTVPDQDAFNIALLRYLLIELTQNFLFFIIKILNFY